MVIVSLFTASARADDSAAEARAASQAGLALYEAGRYREAIEKFEVGYALSKRPIFLINMGQAYRHLFEPERAREKYEAFLAVVPADDPSRPGVEDILREIDRALEGRGAERRAVPAPVALVAPAPRPRRAFVARHWWIFPTSAVVLAGIGVGIYFAVHPPTKSACDGASLACLHAMQ
jgi:tetratricopeptide (TPR) repeat protein